MPNSLFHSISEEKRQRFLQAARTELTEKPYADISISSIAKAAHISRGTVYNYFDSVGDILDYFIEEIRKARYLYLPRIYEEEQFDIFRTFKRLFEYDFEEFERTKRYSIIRNYLAYLHSENKSFKDHFIRKILEPMALHFDKPIYDSTQYKVTEDEFFNALEMIGILLSNLLLQREHTEMTKDELFQRFEFIVNLFQKGITT